MASLALARVLLVYRSSFDTFPNITLAITGATLTAIGDAVAQTAQNVMSDREKKAQPYDFARTLRFFCYGAGISPVIGRWNRFLEARFPLRAVGSSKRISLRALAKRVAADQIVMAPLGLSMFFFSMGIMEGRDWDHIRARFCDLYTPALKANWQAWPLAQLLNFRFVPLLYRVPFSQTCGIFWTLYLSLINSEENKAQERRDQLARMIRQE